MATTLIEGISVLEGYDDDEGRLRRDLGKFSIVETTYGMKLDAVSDEFGHADVGVALAIALPKAFEMLGGMGVLLHSGDDLVGGEEGDLTDDDIEKMPADLRELCEIGKKDEKEKKIEEAEKPEDDHMILYM
jgi:hypothetical protein